MELIRRRSLGLYIYANPINAQQKQYNEIILSKAEAIRCRVFIDVINEKYDFFNQDRLKEDFLIYFKEMVNRNFAKCDAAYKQFEKFCKGKCTFEMLDVVYWMWCTVISIRNIFLIQKYRQEVETLSISLYQETRLPPIGIYSSKS